MEGQRNSPQTAAAAARERAIRLHSFAQGCVGRELAPYLNDLVLVVADVFLCLGGGVGLRAAAQLTALLVTPQSPEAYPSRGSRRRAELLSQIDRGALTVLARLGVGERLAQALDHVMGATAVLMTLGGPDALTALAVNEMLREFFTALPGVPSEGSRSTSPVPGPGPDTQRQPSDSFSPEADPRQTSSNGTEESGDGDPLGSIQAGSNPVVGFASEGQPRDPTPLPRPQLSDSFASNLTESAEPLTHPHAEPFEPSPPEASQVADPEAAEANPLLPTAQVADDLHQRLTNLLAMIVEHNSALENAARKVSATLTQIGVNAANAVPEVHMCTHKTNDISCGGSRIAW